MRMEILFLAALSVQAVLVAEENSAEKINASRYALREIPFDPTKYAPKSETADLNKYAPKEIAGLDEFEKADQAAINEEARLVSKDGKNPDQSDFEYALKKRFGADVDIHDKMSALKVGPYAEPEIKRIVGRKGAAVEWARNHRWADTMPKNARAKVAAVKITTPREWNPGGVPRGYLPQDKPYETSAAWNARFTRKSR